MGEPVIPDIGVVMLPYVQEHRSVGSGRGPEVISQSGLIDEFRSCGHEVIGPFIAALTPEEQRARGGWKAAGLHGRHLKEQVAYVLEQRAFALILEGECTASIGALAGVRLYGERRNTPRAGMVWIDAHADINIPETTLSGMLGGMPVAVSLGWCLPQIRKDIGTVTLSADDLAFVALRNVDPLEREMIDRTGIAEINEHDVCTLSEHFYTILYQLSSRVDLIYVHIDLDVLNPAHIPGMGLPAEGGLTGPELGAALEVMLRDPKVTALGIAAYRPDDDRNGEGLKHIKRLIHTGIAGVRGRRP